MSAPRAAPADVLPRELALAFAPVHKRAFGVAIGTITGLGFFLLTAVYLLRRPDPGFSLWLLREYFYGYTVSWTGALLVLGWGFATGFIAGWFIAWFRNLVLAASLFVTRTRAELAATRDFLDHI